MKWREWLTIHDDDGEEATVGDPSGETFRVRSAALDEEILHEGETDAARGEWDAWCLANIIW